MEFNDVILRSSQYSNRRRWFVWFLVYLFALWILQTLMCLVNTATLIFVPCEYSQTPVRYECCHTPVRCEYCHILVRCAYCRAATCLRAVNTAHIFVRYEYCHLFCAEWILPPFVQCEYCRKLPLCFKVCKHWNIFLRRTNTVLFSTLCGMRKHSAWTLDSGQCATDTSPCAIATFFCILNLPQIFPWYEYCHHYVGNSVILAL
jgi:hypothetical protein